MVFDQCLNVTRGAQEAHASKKMGRGSWWDCGEKLLASAARNCLKSWPAPPRACCHSCLSSSSPKERVSNSSQALSARARLCHRVTSQTHKSRNLGCGWPQHLGQFLNLPYFQTNNSTSENKLHQVEVKVKQKSINAILTSRNSWGGSSHLEVLWTCRLYSKSSIDLQGGTATMTLMEPAVAPPNGWNFQVFQNEPKRRKSHHRHSTARPPKKTGHECHDFSFNNIGAD